MPFGGEGEARDFYAGLLGIPEVTKPPHLAKQGGCWLESRVIRCTLAAKLTFAPLIRATRRFAWPISMFWRSALPKLAFGHGRRTACGFRPLLCRRSVRQPDRTDGSSRAEQVRLSQSQMTGGCSFLCSAYSKSFSATLKRQEPTSLLDRRGLFFLITLSSCHDQSPCCVAFDDASASHARPQRSTSLDHPSTTHVRPAIAQRCGWPRVRDRWQSRPRG